MMSIRFTNGSIALAFAASTNSQIGSLPEAAFGAHGLALGKSAVASPHDALSSSWNLAGITGLEKKTVTVFFGKLPFINLAAGFDVKFVEQSRAGFDAVLENPGIDFGMLYRLPGSHSFLKNLTMGIAIDNLAKPALELSRQREALPRETRLMAEKELRAGDDKLTLLSNLAFPETVASRLHWGIE